MKREGPFHTYPFLQFISILSPQCKMHLLYITYDVIMQIIQNDGIITLGVEHQFHKKICICNNKNCFFNCLPQLQPLDCTGTFLYDHYNYTFHIGIYQIWCKVSKVFEQIQLHILRNFFLLYCVGIDIVKCQDLLLWVGNYKRVKIE